VYQLLRYTYTVEPAYNDIGLCDTSPIASEIYGNNCFLTVNHSIMLFGWNNTSLERHKLSSPFCSRYNRV